MARGLEFTWPWIPAMVVKVLVLSISQYSYCYVLLLNELTRQVLNVDQDEDVEEDLEREMS